MKYRPEIDGVRALAVIAVIVFHANPNVLPGGFIGVDVFFVISGYLITSIIISERQIGSFSLANFYRRRARRLLPALILVMAVSLPFAWCLLLPDEMKRYSQSLVAVTTFSSNVLFYLTSGYFDDASNLKPLLHTWSLAVEEQYYLLFPIFLMTIWRFGQRNIIIIFVILAAVSLASAQFAITYDPSAAFYLLPTRAWELLFGVLAAFYLDKRSENEYETDWFRQVFGVVGLFLVILSTLVFSNNTPFPGIYALVPTFGTTLIILFATSRTAVGRLLANRVLVGLGLISYSAYLWHQPIFAFARQRSLDEPSQGLMAVLAMATFPLAYMSWKFVEMPFRRQKIKTDIVVVALIGSLVFVAFGTAGHLSRGFPGRYAPEDRPLVGVIASDIGRLMQERYMDFHLRKFDESAKVKILVIGDSYSEDLVNALYEGNLLDRIQLSTYHIKMECGNLFLDHDFAEYIDANFRSQCIRSGWYDNPILRERLASADEIWLASRWQAWQTKLLPESVNNLVTTFGKPVRVFGTKNFGDTRIRRLLSFRPAERYSLRNPIGREFFEANRYMKSSLPPGVFVDVYRLLCDSDDSCAPFDKEHQLLSVDGLHLTLAGAKFLGERLASHPLLPFVSLQGGELQTGETLPP
jgi:peptidoglycan/LPS O-acetylase OafA/YrhL